MKYSRFLSVCALTASLLGAGCAPVPHQVPFNESAFAGYGGSGSGTISGQVVTVLTDRSERVAYTNATVKLMPANDYTAEIVTRRFHYRHKMEPADPRFAKYVRRVHPYDNDGHFTFTRVPAGTYYVSCHISWSDPTSYTQDDGTIQSYDIDEDQWVWAKISVGSGQSVRVQSWSQGK